MPAASGQYADSPEVAQRYLEPECPEDVGPLRKNTLGEADARYVVRQIAQGLAHLYENQVVHRDIKLENILVTRVGEARPVDRIADPTIEDFAFKIGDLGFAKELSDHGVLSKTLAGTPLNMAPEMLKGESYTAKVDVWSLGTILYQMLVGQHPFNGRSYTHLLRNVESGAYKIPSDVKLSRDCVDFLSKCLQEQSEDRASFADLLNHPFLRRQSTFINLDYIRDFGASILLNTKASFRLFAYKAVDDKCKYAKLGNPHRQ